MLNPVTSEGSRSGVNWMRANEPSRLRASALASIVLPMPGTSSISTCPSTSSVTSSSSVASALPTMTWAMLDWRVLANWVKSMRASCYVAT